MWSFCWNMPNVCRIVAKCLAGYNKTVYNRINNFIKIKYNRFELKNYLFLIFRYFATPDIFIFIF